MLTSFIALTSIWLLTSTTAQSPAVLDTNGQPLKPGVNYYMLPQNSGNDGLTLVNRNTSCPLYVGLEEKSNQYPVSFTPFVKGEKVVTEGSDVSIMFVDVSTICIQSTAWRIGDELGGRRLIATGGTKSYFRIDKIGGEGNKGYNLAWCPSTSCPRCRLRCGIFGFTTENGKKLLALDGIRAPVLDVVFKRI